MEGLATQAEEHCSRVPVHLSTMFLSPLFVGSAPLTQFRRICRDHGRESLQRLSKLFCHCQYPLSRHSDRYVSL